MTDIVDRLLAHKADIWDRNSTAMKAWNAWRSAIAKGDRSSWPRDGFESLISIYGEDMGEAADEIERLRAAVERTAVVVEGIYGNAKLAEMIRSTLTSEKEEGK